MTTPRRILLLALLPIGDSLFITPAVRVLRDRYPHARIVALTHAATAPVMRGVPAVDEVMVLPLGADWAGPAPLLRALARLRAQRFDAAIDFTSPAYKWISFAAGIPTRTYLKFDPLWWVLPGTHRAWRSTHAARHYYDCARELDLPPWDAVDHAPSLRLPAAEQAAARLFLRRHGAAPGPQTLIALHPGGDWLRGRKQWPPERFAALADRLQRRRQARIVLLGSRDEEALSARIAAAMRTAPIVATGAVSLLTGLALIEMSDLFVGNDSGPLHAAAALGTPYVGIYGPTWPANFHPLPTRPGQGAIVTPARPCRAPHYFVGGSAIWRRACPCAAGPCAALQTIGVDDVYARADALLQRVRGQESGAREQDEALAQAERPVPTRS